MSFGKLSVIKTVGEKPTFVILDKDGQPIATIPDVRNWLFERLGKTISLFESNSYFQLVDQEELKKQ